MSIYKFVLPERETFKPVLLPNRKLTEDYKFHDENGNHWLTVGTDGSWTIESGYAWDGCSPKFKIRDRIVGTWDGWIEAETKLPVNRVPSLLHDIGYQAVGKDGRLFPYTRLMVDKIFYYEMKKRKFLFSKPYYAAVFLFGGVSMRIDKLRKNRKRKKNKCL